MNTAEVLALPALMAEIGRKARIGAQALAIATAQQKQMALTVAAGAINAHRKAILAANARDMAAAEAKGISKAFLDRLLLTDARIDGIIEGLKTIADLPDPIPTAEGIARATAGMLFNTPQFMLVGVAPVDQDPASDPSLVVPGTDTASLCNYLAPFVLRGCDYSCSATGVTIASCS